MRTFLICRAGYGTTSLIPLEKKGQRKEREINYFQKSEVIGQISKYVLQLAKCKNISFT